ncbi:MAG: cobyric acid synthase [Desulfomonile tiedjei]|uniref:Cobyric acid synthase n=1 Tax=Desulfomonile tiedjei TaxID=2358 RepID=A0A9D6Z6J6_9BACT|nr:cobyric acid synthase [Desulfomonile tiedjei]
MAVPKHGGNLAHLSSTSGIARDKIVDFSANINPLGLPEWFRSVVSSVLESVVHYPDPENASLISAVSRRYGIDVNEAIVGNGSTEIVHLLTRVLNAKRAVIPAPTYSDYEEAASNARLDVLKFYLPESEDFMLDLNRLQSELRGDEIVFLCNPNNPTGRLLDSVEIRSFAEANPSSTFIVDEAFGDFVQNFDSLTKDRPNNVVVLLSLTKIFAIPGLRLGAAVADSSVVRAVRDLQPSWSVNTIAQAVGEAALNDSEYVEASREFVCEPRSELRAELESLPGLKVYPGVANFLLLRIDRNDLNAVELARRTLQYGIAVRVCANFGGLDGRFFRVAVRTPEENKQLLEALKKALGIQNRIRKTRKKPALMFQGTSSNAGKSVLTAAMCRILLQDGYTVAPFKSQNMSLNSFVTRTGGEMGRAQVVQSQACRLEPDVRMNPILLKPNSDTGSQVIVSGKPVGNMDVMEYVKYKPVAFEAAKASYDSLAEEFDVIVLEGAGSPGEVNLKHHDIVNMQMAKYADAPVILVGDIDRGGVFASFVGTMEVLAEWERAQVAGFLVNKFRGNEDLLKDATEYTWRHTRRPVLGIVPYFHNLGLPEEDSVTFKSGIFPDSSPSTDFIEIAVIDLPHISNFTDFDAFRIEPDVSLKVIRKATDLRQPDAVILPGSKNVIGDLEFLIGNGIASRIREIMANGTEVIGICGGFQMIGAGIADPHYLESDGKTIAGLDFLDVTTVLALEKTLTRTTGMHLESGLSVRGYEIHHGQSECRGTEPFVRQESGLMEGAKTLDGKVWGTYLHGIFDADEFRRWFIDKLRLRKGLEPRRIVCAHYDLEPALERLAETVRRSVNMDDMYRLMRL